MDIRHTHTIGRGNELGIEQGGVRDRAISGIHLFALGDCFVCFANSQ